jgi:hypothetical protein
VAVLGTVRCIVKTPLIAREPPIPVSEAMGSVRLRTMDSGAAICCFLGWGEEGAPCVAKWLRQDFTNSVTEELAPPKW